MTIFKFSIKYYVLSFNFILLRFLLENECHSGMDFGYSSGINCAVNCRRAGIKWIGFSGTLFDSIYGHWFTVCSGKQPTIVNKNEQRLSKFELGLLEPFSCNECRSEVWFSVFMGASGMKRLEIIKTSSIEKVKH